MADRVNSSKKVEYAQGIGEILAAAKSDIQKTVSNLESMCGKYRFATADRAYNEIAKIGNVTIEAINQYAGGVATEVLTPLISGEGGAMSGQALVTKVKSIIPELEAIAAKTSELPLIPQSVVDSRGLDEDWTDANCAAFGEECKAFIGIRAKLMAQVADITTKCGDVDTKVVYNNLGKKFEEFCNQTAVAYKDLKDQLDRAGILLKETADKMESAYSAITAECAGKTGDVLGGVDDV